MLRHSAILFFVVLFLFSCKETKDKPDETENKPEVVVLKAPVFNPDSAFWYIAKQTEFGPRVPNTNAHVAIFWWLRFVNMALPFRSKYLKPERLTAKC
jgi:hypothetical protein